MPFTFDVALDIASSFNGQCAKYKLQILSFAFDGPLRYCQIDPDLAREPTMKLRRRTIAVVAVAALLSLAVCGIVAWRVESALSTSRRDAAQKELLAVEERTLGAQPNPGFEGISAPAVFKSAALFQGGICLAGPAGLYAYSADGVLEHLYRVGIDLPAAPLGHPGRRRPRRPLPRLSRREFPHRPGRRDQRRLPVRAEIAACRV